ncbi:MAG: hypothetical protein QXX19_08080 [Candidatus Caldarchaeum sp.]
MQLIFQSVWNKLIHHVVRVLVLLHKPKSLSDSVNVGVYREVRLIETEREYDPGGLLSHAIKFQELFHGFVGA